MKHRKHSLRRRYGHAATTTAEWRSALAKDIADLASTRRQLAILERGGHVQNLTLDGAWARLRGLEAAIHNKQKILGGSR
jgi:hypothetical protein